MNKQRIEAAKSKLDEFMTKAKSSDCWKKAVEGIEKRCKNLGHTEQSYLAIDFTNCHQSKSGRKSYFCSRKTQSIEECTGKMDDTTRAQKRILFCALIPRTLLTQHFSLTQQTSAFT